MTRGRDRERAVCGDRLCDLCARARRGALARGTVRPAWRTGAGASLRSHGVCAESGVASGSAVYWYKQHLRDPDRLRAHSSDDPCGENTNFLSATLVVVALRQVSPLTSTLLSTNAEMPNLNHGGWVGGAAGGEGRRAPARSRSL